MSTTTQSPVKIRSSSSSSLIPKLAIKTPLKREPLKKDDKSPKVNDVKGSTFCTMCKVYEEAIENKRRLLESYSAELKKNLTEAEAASSREESLERRIAELEEANKVLRQGGEEKRETLSTDDNKSLLDAKDRRIAELEAEVKTLREIKAPTDPSRSNDERKSGEEKKKQTYAVLGPIILINVDEMKREEKKQDDEHEVARKKHLEEKFPTCPSGCRHFDHMPYEWRFTRECGKPFGINSLESTEEMFAYSFFGKDVYELAGRSLVLDIPYGHLRSEFERDNPMMCAFFRAVCSTAIHDSWEDDPEESPCRYLPGGKNEITTAEDVCSILRTFCSMRNISMVNIGNKHVTFYWSIKGHSYKYIPTRD